MANFETWFFWPWTVWCSISGKVPSVKYLWWALFRKSVHVFLLQYYNSQNFQSCTSCRFNQLKTVFVNWILFPEFLDWLFWNKPPRFYIPKPATPGTCGCCHLPTSSGIRTRCIEESRGWAVDVCAKWSQKFWILGLRVGTKVGIFGSILKISPESK